MGHVIKLLFLRNKNRKIILESKYSIFCATKEHSIVALLPWTKSGFIHSSEPLFPHLKIGYNTCKDNSLPGLQLLSFKKATTYVILTAVSVSANSKTCMEKTDNEPGTLHPGQDTEYPKVCAGSSILLSVNSPV